MKETMAEVVAERKTPGHQGMGGPAVRVLTASESQPEAAL
jgi:hypothetical protein